MAESDSATAQGQPQQQGISVDHLGHDVGSKTAQHWVVEFLDFGCSYCSKFAFETYPALAKEYVETGKVHWKFIPFVIGMFRNSEDAAIAAECAAEQGKFLVMHDSLYAARKEWMAAGTPSTVFTRMARRIGLSLPAFTKCTAGTNARARVRQASEIARQANIRGTPTFFISGQRVEGAIPLPLFRQVMQQLTSGSAGPVR